MQLRLEWSKHELRDGAKEGLPLTTDLEKLPQEHGIYIFGRDWGDNFEALYVGKADDLRRRIKTQLNNARLMNHVKNTSTGYRVVYTGIFRAGKAQQWDICAPILEKGLIRYFIAKEHRLSNKQGSEIKVHSILSEGTYARREWEKEISVEK